ncbi:uncharacterized protein Z520_05242 [Fonsecaea multimorphosa CBS 102226]|uniref:Major facilitator superfamily (MFS) profile domain-containing protein n=1 Tax=Fonsecaea multimorphosa CBS 102226 TaxID=1442371 RepID=A0A0D2IP75_9EURO|nr:uncharacterized protein Z520_05242 [Fonsecaea multimorphosa CBS 102226]KIX98781.1 hypothetical protein Z520_05242 [Fonsecaea multimorphosa CBS 102226]OAL25062.1 hypothetical protein AYO22_04939 [Fonsecaea multimorphosa]
MFTATKLQVATYLLGVCPFSIAFLVFLNSSVSFVITDLIGKEDAVGDAVGTLGFADELVALVACPLWGLLSDRMGLRPVCVAGYLIICLALVLFVQAKNVYPQLLLARLFFSLGGAAASTMVTAILPAVATPSTNYPAENQRAGVAAAGNGHATSPSIESEVTITPARFVSRSSQRKSKVDLTAADSEIAGSTSRVAGFVGMFTGFGALIALTLFLPLPAKFQYAGIGEKAALKDSFYIVAAVAFLLAIWCFFGLRRLHSDAEDYPSRSAVPRRNGAISRLTDALTQMLNNFQTAIMAGFQRSEIAIGYLGGFVARASSVGISLFIPLLVNATFLSSGLCVDPSSSDDPTGLPDIKRRCPRAYVVAAELTGVTELVALVFAPVFGYWAARATRKEIPLLVASMAGIIGYPLFANEFDPDDRNTSQRAAAFFAVCLIGISQIGAIVCSLGTLSKGVLRREARRPPNTSEHNGQGTDARLDEESPLLTAIQQGNAETPLSALKGSVAGVYSLYGGAAILILTKVGGLLFDKVSLAGPFYIMAIFNATLMLACLISSLLSSKERATQPEPGPQDGG